LVGFNDGVTLIGAYPGIFVLGCPNSGGFGENIFTTKPQQSGGRLSTIQSTTSELS